MSLIRISIGTRALKSMSGWVGGWFGEEQVHVVRFYGSPSLVAMRPCWAFLTVHCDITNPTLDPALPSGEYKAGVWGYSQQKNH